MRRRSLALTACLVVLAVTTTEPLAVADTVPVVIDGYLVDAGNTPIEGAVVGLYLDSDTDAKRYEPPLLASAVTDAAGHFALKSDVTSAASDLADQNDGYVNFYIDAVSPSGTQILSYYFSRVYVAGEWTTGDAPATTATLTLASGAKGVRSLKRSVGRLLVYGMLGGVRACGGSAWVTRNTTNAYTDVGELHMIGGMDGYFRYARTNTADSDIGIAVSGNQFGPWSLSGSTHIGTENTTVVTWNRGPQWSKQVRTQFEYKKQELVGGCGQSLGWRVKAFDHAAGGLDGDDMSQFDHRCDEYPYYQYDATFAPGTEFDRYANNAVTWNQAVSAFGAVLSSQSGYSDKVWAHWNFDKERVICGNNDILSRSTRIWAGT